MLQEVRPGLYLPSLFCAGLTDACLPGDWPAGYGSVSFPGQIALGPSGSLGCRMQLGLSGAQPDEPAWAWAPGEGPAGPVFPRIALEHSP